MRTTKISPSILAALLLVSWAGSLAAQGSKQKVETAVIAGTVFRDPGFAQGGAVVVLALKSSPTKKLQEQITASRGEFSFRIPAGPQSYVVSATLKGFQTAREEIEIQGLEQINATLLLVPESKKAR
ncbi:MAG TPA: carboxypeptidase-like regulatory domain-containing protein [Bryobacteraceae bacterium]|nr:carboxypeptidase-like regulatory domain-containing protein [Bryobacteraceae bacterium]